MSWKGSKDGQIESLVFLQKTASFVNFGMSGMLIAKLTKSPLVLSPCLRASVVVLFFEFGLPRCQASSHLATKSPTWRA